jgi:4-hydroxy-3-methylbut-2-enyl diphosphate reductase
MPGRSDLCFATTNRQTALRAIADKADAVIVIGSENSSNTVALAKTAKAAGCERVYRVNSADELPDDLSGVVGVTAGASAPEELVEAVLARLAPRDGVEEVQVTDEDEYFPPPRELRQLLADKGRGDALADDRARHASDVLASLRAL